MSIVSARPEIRRPKSTSVDPGHQSPGPRLAEAPGPDVAEAGRMAEWFDAEVQAAYPDTWAEIGPNPLRARIWIAAGFDLAELRVIVRLIIASGCPVHELIDRIADDMGMRMRVRARRREAEEREREEAGAKRDAEGERALFRRLIAESAGRFDQATATAERIERRELADDEDGTWQGLREIQRQARDSARRAERELAARLEGALPWLAPGRKARDADGWPAPFGVVVEGVAYLLVGDVESEDERAALVARVPLDRIIGLG